MNLEERGERGGNDFFRKNFFVAKNEMRFFRLHDAMRRKRFGWEPLLEKCIINNNAETKRKITDIIKF